MAGDCVEKGGGIRRASLLAGLQLRVKEATDGNERVFFLARLVYSWYARRAGNWETTVLARGFILLYYTEGAKGDNVKE